MTKSMHIALEDLKLDELYVIYPGPIAYQLANNVFVEPLWDFITGPLAKRAR